MKDEVGEPPPRFKKARKKKSMKNWKKSFKVFTLKAKTVVTACFSVTTCILEEEHVLAQKFVEDAQMVYSYGAKTDGRRFKNEKPPEVGAEFEVPIIGTIGTEKELRIDAQGKISVAVEAIDAAVEADSANAVKEAAEEIEAKRSGKPAEVAEEAVLAVEDLFAADLFMAEEAVVEEDDSLLLTNGAWMQDSVADDQAVKEDQDVPNFEAQADLVVRADNPRYLVVRADQKGAVGDILGPCAAVAVEGLAVDLHSVIDSPGAVKDHPDAVEEKSANKDPCNPRNTVFEGCMEGRTVVDIQRAFGPYLKTVKGAMKQLARKYPKDEIGWHGYRLYAKFRPKIVAGIASEDGIDTPSFKIEEQMAGQTKVGAKEKTGEAEQEQRRRLYPFHKFEINAGNGAQIRMQSNGAADVDVEDPVVQYSLSPGFPRSGSPVVSGLGSPHSTSIHDLTSQIRVVFPDMEKILTIESVDEAGTAGAIEAKNRAYEVAIEDGIDVPKFESIEEEKAELSIIGEAQNFHDLADAFEIKAGEQRDVSARPKTMLYDGSSKTNSEPVRVVQSKEAAEVSFADEFASEKDEKIMFVKAGAFQTNPSLLEMEIRNKLQRKFVEDKEMPTNADHSIAAAAQDVVEDAQIKGGPKPQISYPDQDKDEAAHSKVEDTRDEKKILQDLQIHQVSYLKVIEMAALIMLMFMGEHSKEILEQLLKIKGENWISYNLQQLCYEREAVEHSTRSQLLEILFHKRNLKSVQLQQNAQAVQAQSCACNFKRKINRQTNMSQRWLTYIPGHDDFG